MATQPAFKWSTYSAPSSPARLSASGVNATFTFGKAVAYTVAVQSGSIIDKKALNVVATPSSITVSQVGGAAEITGNTMPEFTVSQFLDQFKATISETTQVAWSATTLPAVRLPRHSPPAAAPRWATFKAAGQYVLKATESDMPVMRFPSRSPSP